MNTGPRPLIDRGPLLIIKEKSNLVFYAVVKNAQKVLEFLHTILQILHSNIKKM